MAIRGLGDVNVETTISGTGEASQSRSFTQTTNDTYSVDVSSNILDTNSSSNTWNNLASSTTITRTIGSGPVFYRVEASFTIDVGSTGGTTRDDDWVLYAVWDGHRHTLASGTVSAGSNGSDTDSVTINNPVRADQIELEFDTGSTDSDHHMSATVYEGQTSDASIDSITQQ